MKSLIQRILQTILGYQTYLWVFTKYKLKVLRKDKSEQDFFHFLTLLDPQDAVLDIGANLGLMSYYLAQKCKEVHAFEPMPNNIRILERLKTHYKLSNIVIHKVALGELNGEIELILPIVNGVRKQGLSHVKDDKMTDFNEGTVVISPVFKLDDYRPTKSIPIKAIKIDVENFEFEVFKGAKETLVKFKPMIYCELWDNQNRYDCFEFLRSLGYETYILAQNELIKLDSNQSNTQNFFFIHPQS